MVEATRAVRLATARPPDQQVCAPAATLHLAEQALCIVRSYAALETVEQQYVRSVGSAVRVPVQPVDFQEVAVGCFPSFQSRRDRSALAGEPSPERLSMSTRYPPGCSVMNGSITHVC
jgi:hypothetical protein